MARALSIDVFNSGYKPIPGGPGWDDSAPATWPATTSTLISGQRRRRSSSTRCSPRDEGERLAAWVQNTGNATPRDLRDPRSRRSLLRRRASAGRLPRRRS